MTETQQRVYDFIAAFIREHRYSPSYQEIADALGMGGKSKPHRIVQRLIADGHLAQDKHRQRSLRLANPVARIASKTLRHELIARGELYSPAIMACIKRAGLEAHL